MIDQSGFVLEILDILEKAGKGFGLVCNGQELVLAGVIFGQVAIHHQIQIARAGTRLSPAACLVISPAGRGFASPRSAFTGTRR
ncbi:hypothetical protein [Pseudomonas savastanoi]|uniref:hypothetical protein n=1 Tax=Pseudomonas savastanoi TaxID=29438 RepID=UPI001F19267B|nr:hypothetical protein [Pseudomonas savastanoi]